MTRISAHTHDAPGLDPIDDDEGFYIEVEKLRAKLGDEYTDDELRAMVVKQYREQFEELERDDAECTRKGRY